MEAAKKIEFCVIYATSAITHRGVNEQRYLEQPKVSIVFEKDEV
jgi:hypothetical protein